MKHTPERLVLTFGLDRAYIETEECRKARFTVPRKFEELGAHMVAAYNATYAAGMTNPAAEIARLRSELETNAMISEDLATAEADLREALDALVIAHATIKRLTKSRDGSDADIQNDNEREAIFAKHGRAV